eukprot:COSAG01_NODE_8697_length_2693_cov_2.548574_1_plen_62_part_10
MSRHDTHAKKSTQPRLGSLIALFKSPPRLANAWGKGHIVWHTVASLTCCLGCLSGAYVCDQL